MVEKFTEKAIKAIILGQEETRRLGHNFVGTEEIILGLIGEGTGVAAKVLKSMGVHLKDARIEVEKIIGRGSGFVTEEIPFTPRAKRVLELSLEEARQLGHNYIGTEHLLLGLICEGEGVAARVLENLGVDLSKVRTQIIRMLAEPAEVAAGSASTGNTKTSTLDEIDSQFPSLVSLLQEFRIILKHINFPALRIAVFAPFNHGKSTLLNALLGSRTLPIDLIPTTGTAIVIKHGDILRARIQLREGNEIWRDGTEILQEYAILDGDRRMREDVVSIEVYCPHPLLAKSVELIDLPGTSDMEAQDALVYNQLLTADVVISVLDARKLLTMTEVDKLQEWLIDRGIKTAIFLVNFTNLIEEGKERKEIVDNARLIANEFRGYLPNNISNLYRVDALPALRAKVKGDRGLAMESGIVDFENALFQIIDLMLPQIKQVRLPRVYAIGDRVREFVDCEIQKLKNEIIVIEGARNAEIERGEKEAMQMKSNFLSSVNNLENWLSTDYLVTQYIERCLQSLLNDELTEFLSSLQDTLYEYTGVCDNFIKQGCKKFNTVAPYNISISLPDFPEIDKPVRLSDLDEKSGAGVAAVVGGFLGFIVGGPLVATAAATAAAAVTNSDAKKRKEKLEAEYHSEVKAVNRALKDFLRRFSEAGLEIISDYKNSTIVFAYTPPAEDQTFCDKRKSLTQLESFLCELDESLTRSGNIKHG